MDSGFNAPSVSAFRRSTSPGRGGICGSELLPSRGSWRRSRLRGIAGRDCGLDAPSVSTASIHLPRKGRNYNALVAPLPGELAAKPTEGDCRQRLRA